MVNRGLEQGSGAHWGLAVLLSLAIALIGTFSVRPAAAQEASEDVVNREAHFDWDADTGLLYLDLLFRDIMDADLQSKLSRGLPTTIVLTAAIYRVGSAKPLSTTAQTCKVTWHVWEEAYMVEVMRPGSARQSWTTTTEGVIRRCTEVRHLLAGDRSQVPVGVPLLAAGRIQVNPVSPELLQKISNAGSCAPAQLALLRRETHCSVPSRVCFCNESARPNVSRSSPRKPNFH